MMFHSGLCLNKFVHVDETMTVSPLQLSDIVLVEILISNVGKLAQPFLRTAKAMWSQSGRAWVANRRAHPKGQCLVISPL